MKNKCYKNRGYKEITTTETPYLNIYTGQRIFIDPEVVPPKSLFYVEDLNPYQRTISIVMEGRNRKIIHRDQDNIANNIYRLLKSRLDYENRSQIYYNNTTYSYPLWFEDLLEILYFENFV